MDDATPPDHGEETWEQKQAWDRSNEASQALAALAPELAALVLAQNEEIQEKAKQHHRSWGHEKSFAKCIWPICESARDFAARLDRLGKEQT